MSFQGTRLRAIQNIPGSIQIYAGQEFIELDPDQARYWVESGFASRLSPEPPTSMKVEAVKLPDADKALIEQVQYSSVNRRGWDVLNWDGMTVAILASGESLTQEVADKVRDWRKASESRRVIVINTTFLRAFWADLLYACDGRWWECIPPGAAMSYVTEAKSRFAGELWTLDQPVAIKHDLKFIRSDKQRGLSRKPGLIHQGGNSGYQAMNLAYLAGVSKMILFGFDCKGGHWHGDHPAGLVNRSPFKDWIHQFQYLARDLKAEGVEVLNANPDSAIPWFNKTTAEEALQ